MATNVKYLDPVRGLVNYALDVKPYHTKIVEVLVEYVYQELVGVVIADRSVMDIGLICPPIDVDGEVCPGGYDTLVYGGESRIAIVSPNASIDAIDYPAINAGTNSVIVPGDATKYIKFGMGVQLTAAIEDFSNEFSIVGVTAGTVGSGSFDVPGDHASLYVAGYQFTVRDSFGNDGEYTVAAGGSSFSGNTTIPVVQDVLAAAAGGNLGLTITYTNNTGSYTVTNALFVNGSIDSMPGNDPSNYTTGDEPHTIITLSPGLSTIPITGANQIHVAYIIPDPLPIINAVQYSSVQDDEPNEGLYYSTIQSVVLSTPSVPDTGKFTIPYDMSDSNLLIGSTFRVIEHQGNSGTYTIASIMVSGSPAYTTIGVVEDISSSSVTGLIQFTIPANSLFIAGDFRSRFTQGKAVTVVGGSVAGEYTVVSSSFVDGNTHIRVLEPIPDGPFVAGTLVDNYLGYDDRDGSCGSEIEGAVTNTIVEQLTIEWVSSYEISSVNQPSYQIFVAGDVTTVVISGEDVRITDSGGNDGTYGVSTVEWLSGSDNTRITLASSLPVATAPGQHGTVNVDGAI
jgi:hypothetical protein